MILLQLLAVNQGLNINYFRKKILEYDDQILTYLNELTAFEDAVTGYEKSIYHNDQTNDQIDYYYYLNVFEPQKKEHAQLLEQMKKIINIMIDLIKINEYLFNKDLLKKLEKIRYDKKELYNYLKPKILNYEYWRRHIVQL